MTDRLMSYSEACRRLARAGVLPDGAEPSPVAVLEELKELSAAGRLPADGPAIWYAVVAHLRYLADYYERDLIRGLKFGDGKTWAEVADAVGVLGTRQAAQQKWSRLIANDRRTTTGQMRRGGRPKTID